MTWSTVSFCFNIFIKKKKLVTSTFKYLIVYGCWIKINHQFSTQLKSKSESITRQRNLQTLSTKKDFFALCKNWSGTKKVGHCRPFSIYSLLGTIENDRSNFNRLRHMILCYQDIDNGQRREIHPRVLI